MSDYTTCEICITYAEGRTTVLPHYLAVERAWTGETGQQILDRFMGGIHERHLAGLSLVVTA